jgi:phosphoglycolate phosphatase-like HAD superfamily hydrolase
MRLALFDLDGTLILTNGAGMRAFYQALRSGFDIHWGSEPIRPDGKTDPLIAKELLASQWDPERQQKLFAAYLNYLEIEMSRARDSGSILILSGVLDLLEALSSQHDFAVGLVTGNLEQGARIKLEKAGLSGYFRFGSYGSDSEDRTILTKIGIQRGIREIAPAPFECAYVIGDTPFDIVHGHAAEARVIAVASGRYSLDELRSYNPDLLLPDLTATDFIISFMRGAAVSGPI